MKKNEIDLKYVMCLFSNISLLNALKYTQINLQKNIKIKENNLKDHFKFNDFWIGIKNKYIKSEENYNNNSIEEIKKLQKKHKKKEEFNILEEKFTQYLSYIRNYYSHTTEKQNYKQSDRWLEKNENNIVLTFKNIFQKSCNDVYLKIWKI